MATSPTPRTAAPARKGDQASQPKSPMFSLALLAGWLVPGAGHLLTRHRIRAAVLFSSITLMFVLGLLMQGKLYVGDPANPLSFLGLLADLGSGLLYIGSRIAGAGQTPVQVVTADYGTIFIVVAGLLNVIAAVDAHNLAIGRKR